MGNGPLSSSCGEKGVPRDGRLEENNLKSEMQLPNGFKYQPVVCVGSVCCVSDDDIIWLFDRFKT